MFRKKKILAVITAKGNSTRIKNKNIKKYLNSSLLEISIVNALKSKYICDVCITSESQKILNISKKYPVILIKRPKKLSNNLIMPDYAVVHAINKIKKKFDYIILLHPTSPLRSYKHIDEAIVKAEKEKADSLLSAFKTHSFLWKRSKKNYIKPINYNYLKRPRSQDNIQFQENGAIYVTKAHIYKKYNNRLGGRISVYPMNFWDSFDVDNVEDLKNIQLLQKSFK